jgi:diguanylate cyclase (GGDEF)-like protein
MDQGSWLFPDGVDRERMLEMDRHLQPVRRATFGVVAVSLLVMGPWLGWWTVVPVLLAAMAFRLADTRIDRLDRPEYALFAAWVSSQVIIAGAVALTGGPHVPTMAWLAIPIVTLGARFSERGIALGVAVSIALMLAVSVSIDARAIIDYPPLVIAPIALMVAVAMFQTVLMRSDVKYRAEAVIDPLTGMLNRKALIQRGAELAEQSQVTKLPVGLVVGDVDHFKQINDVHGHACGDAVLKGVAYELRKSLRAFDLFYRIGGEEFLVLLPGADAQRAGELAEQLRVAIADQPLAGQPVTMSFGAAASAPGERFDYETVFALADAALYEAKRTGRDRVCVPPDTGVLVPA